MEFFIPNRRGHSTLGTPSLFFINISMASKKVQLSFLRPLICSMPIFISKLQSDLALDIKVIDLVDLE